MFLIYTLIFHVVTPVGLFHIAGPVGYNMNNPDYDPVGY